MPQPANVINLMDALRRSIAAEKAEAEKSRDRGACRRRRDPAQETRGSSRHRTRQSPQGAEQEDKVDRIPPASTRVDQLVL